MKKQKKALLTQNQRLWMIIVMALFTFSRTSLVQTDCDTLFVRISDKALTSESNPSSTNLTRGPESPVEPVAPALSVGPVAL